MNTDKVAMDILNAIRRVENRKKMKNFCDTCKYNTNHSQCRDCDGRSKYVTDEN